MKAKSSHFFGGLLCAFAATTAAQAATIYVDINGPGSGPWASAYQDLQAAINAANGGDEIWVADGTYLAPVISMVHGFNINKAVNIYGGFAGNETQWSQRDFVNNLTILSGDAGVVGDRSDNRTTVVRVTFTTSSNIRLDGFTIRDAWGTNAQGGAVFPSAGIVIGVGSSPTIQNCRIIANRGHPMDGAGGGLFFDGRSAAQILDTLFEDNSAGEGGAIYLDHSNQEIDAPTIERCRFIRNVAGRAGGGISMKVRRPSGLIDWTVFQSVVSLPRESGLCGRDAGTPRTMGNATTA
ncbi:MAG: hypothetical protein DCC65_12620 [Planctomycetota bacterium]|nr:MAG: hypothetical protein DCC65_12620 [Planctomycetota bacterium]